MSFFKKIGLFFKSLFNAAQKAYNKLSPEEQQALQAGSGIVAIINNKIDSSPAVIRKAIAERFPELDTAKLEEVLDKLLTSYGLPYTTIDEAIEAIQKRFNSLEGKDWAVASHAAASLIAALFAPKETKVAVIVSLLEFVYRVFFKKDLEHAK